jgi:predicted alpha/beta-fold hydrolase
VVLAALQALGGQVEDRAGRVAATRHQVAERAPADHPHAGVAHGLGGDAGSGYCVQLAQAALDEGVSCLRLSLRGADGVGIIRGIVGNIEDSPVNLGGGLL